MSDEPERVERLILTPDEVVMHCATCVFYPPNLPATAYSADDYKMLREKDCCFDFQPGDGGCLQTRKTSCSLLDLERLK